MKLGLFFGLARTEEMLKDCKAGKYGLLRRKKVMDQS